jgi:hypothetical protein
MSEFEFWLYMGFILLFLIAVRVAEGIEKNAENKNKSNK